MSSTSQKHRNFVSEPMGEKPVTDLAGIGETYGQRLENQGFDKVKYINWAYEYVNWSGYVVADDKICYVSYRRTLFSDSFSF